MTKTTLILQNSFFLKKFAFVFGKVVLLNKADQFPLKKFNFSVTVLFYCGNFIKKETLAQAFSC